MLKMFVFCSICRSLIESRVKGRATEKIGVAEAAALLDAMLTQSAEAKMFRQFQLSTKKCCRMRKRGFFWWTCSEDKKAPFIFTEKRSLRRPCLNADHFSIKTNQRKWGFYCLEKKYYLLESVLKTSPVKGCWWCMLMIIDCGMHRKEKYCKLITTRS